MWGNLAPGRLSPVVAFVRLPSDGSAEASGREVKTRPAQPRLRFDPCRRPAAAMKPSLLAVLVIVLAGCETPQPAPTKRPSAGLSGLQFAPGPTGTPTADALNDIAATLSTVGDVMAVRGDWPQTHARMQAAIAGAPAATRALVEQAAAVQMLTRVLSRGDARAQADAAALYVEALARQESPELGVVADAVDRFAWVWGPARTAEIATRAADRADAYLARQRAAGPLGFSDQRVVGAVGRLRARAE